MSRSDRLTPVLRDRLRHLLGTRGWPRAIALRRLISAALVLLAAVLALRSNPARGAPTAPVLVAAHDLAPGTTLTPDDVRVVPAPAALVPAAALGSVEAAAGRVLAGAAGAGEPITGARLVGPEHTRLLTRGADAVAVAVRLADSGIADLLSPGTRVDVVTVEARGTAGSLLASNAVVVTVRPGERDQTGRLVVIAMPPESATAVASASLGQPVTVTLR